MDHKKYQQKLSQRSQNTDKIKEKYRQAAQHQFMTNYYLSKYDSFMMKHSPAKNPHNLQNAYQSAIPNNSSINQERNHHYKFHTQTSSLEKDQGKNRKNFKIAILEKKYANNYNTNTKSNNRKGIQVIGSIKQENISNKNTPKESPSRNNKSAKNFKQEVQLRNSNKKQSKEKYKNFQRLEGSIINQLYSPSPSKIESGKNYSIQIQHRTSYGNTQNNSNPFILFPAQEGSQDNIQVYNDEQSGLFRQQQSYYSVKSNQDNDLNRIQQGIRSSFEKRKKNLSKSPKKSQQKLIHRQYQSNNQKIKQDRPKFPPKSPNNSYHQKYGSQFGKQFSQDQNILRTDTIRPGFYNIQRQKVEENSLRQSRKHSQEKSSRFHDSKIDGTHSAIVGNQINYLSRSMRHSRFNKSNRGNSNEKNSDSFQDSLNNININNNKNMEYSRDEKTPPSSQFQNHYPHNSPLITSRSHEKPPTQFKEETNQLSMISRFSMTSDEGGYIREHIQQEINQRFFGPYQQALSSLKDLMDEFPHVWPIFVVGQRILQDRQQYDMKRQNQDKELQQIQSKIKNINRKIKQRQQTSNDIDNNSRTILYLVRKLAGQIHEQN